MKLNQKQYEVLTVVEEGTSGDNYFVPFSRPRYIKTLGKEIWFNGAGDAATFKFLFRNGLAKNIPVVNPYACAITENGVIALEEYRQANVYVNGHFPV